MPGSTSSSQSRNPGAGVFFAGGLRSNATPAIAKKSTASHSQTASSDMVTPGLGFARHVAPHRLRGPAIQVFVLGRAHRPERFLEQRLRIVEVDVFAGHRHYAGGRVIAKRNLDFGHPDRRLIALLAKTAYLLRRCAVEPGGQKLTLPRLRLLGERIPVVHAYLVFRRCLFDFVAATVERQDHRDVAFRAVYGLG